VRKTPLEPHLLEPDLERRVENGDEGDGLLSGSLGDVEEECLVLRREELLLGRRVDAEEEVDKQNGVVERGEALEDRLLDLSSSVDAGKPLLNPSEPVSGEVPKRYVEPARLVRDIHQADHPLGDLFVGHLPNVGDDPTVALLSEPGLVEVLVETTDDIVLLGLEPGSALLLGHVEDGVVELSPELDSSGRDLVNGLAEFGADSKDASGLLVVGRLPLVVLDSRSGDDEGLDGGRGLGLLRDHDSGREENSVEGHGLSLEHLDGPVSGEAGSRKKKDEGGQRRDRGKEKHTAQ
jgi:hypothetical protein